jgi:hypothetical protein
MRAHEDRPPKITGRIIAAYSEMLREREEQGWQLFLITLMFNQLKGSRESVIRQMHKGAERAYATLLNQMYRHPLRGVAAVDFGSRSPRPQAQQAAPSRRSGQWWNAPKRNRGNPAKHPA